MQCKALRDSAREIQSFDVAYFMASVDTLEENTAFAEEHQAGFPILSDPEKRMTKDYGVLMAAGFARRWTYYIDVDGTILKIDKETKPATAGRWRVGLDDKASVMVDGELFQHDLKPRDFDRDLRFAICLPMNFSENESQRLLKKIRQFHEKI